jgi:hypothetical protein
MRGHVTAQQGKRGGIRLILAKLAIAAVAASVLGGTTAGTSAGGSRAAAAPAAVTTLRCSPASGDRLSYFGGVVDANAEVYLVFWGSWWKAHGSDARTRLEDLFAGLGGSSWAKTVSQYCWQPFGPAGGWQHPGSSSGSLLFGGRIDIGTIIDSRNPPSGPSDNQLAAEARKETPAIPPDTTIVIVTPPGVRPKSDLSKNGKVAVCARHTWTTYTSSGGTYGLPWIDLPYGIISSTASIFVGGRNCQYGKGAIAGLTVNAGHEWAEMLTDPFINSEFIPHSPYRVGSGWGVHNSPIVKNAVGDEVADLCSPGPSDVFGPLVRKYKRVLQIKLKTGTFWMQQLWSNEAKKCVNGS